MPPFPYIFSDHALHVKPHVPKNANTVLQFVASITNGATTSPSTDPTLNPLNTNPTARERSLTLTLLAMISVAAAGATPSPNPTNARKKNMLFSSTPTIGIAIVAADRMSIPIGNTLAPPILVDRYPPGNCDTANP